MTATRQIAAPTMAPTHRNPPTIEVIASARPAGGGLTVGFSSCWRWMLWLMLWFIAWVSVPPIQKGMVRAYTPDRAYQPATASWSGLVHEVGWRTVGCGWL